MACGRRWCGGQGAHSLSAAPPSPHHLLLVVVGQSALPGSASDCTRHLATRAGGDGRQWGRRGQVRGICCAARRQPTRGPGLCPVRPPGPEWRCWRGREWQRRGRRRHGQRRWPASQPELAGIAAAVAGLVHALSARLAAERDPTNKWPLAPPSVGERCQRRRSVRWGVRCDGRRDSRLGVAVPRGWLARRLPTPPMRC